MNHTSENRGDIHLSGKNKSRRRGSFFAICAQCKTDHSCCHDTKPPVTSERRKIIETYLEEEKFPLENIFIEAHYTFPRLDADGYCIFHDRKTRKCAIHSVKPETCVAGPITFDINKKTEKIEWYIKKEKMCQLAKTVFSNKRSLHKHFRVAKKEIGVLLNQLGSEALISILKKEEPETFKIGEDNIDKRILDKLCCWQEHSGPEGI
jgi:Fe-S-cluster containining protein